MLYSQKLQNPILFQTGGGGARRQLDTKFEIVNTKYQQQQTKKLFISIF